MKPPRWHSPEGGRKGRRWSPAALRSQAVRQVEAAGDCPSHAGERLEALGKRSVTAMPPETMGLSGPAPRPPEPTAAWTIPQTPCGVPDAAPTRGDVYNGFKYAVWGLFMIQVRTERTTGRHSGWDAVGRPGEPQLRAGRGAMLGPCVYVTAAVLA